MAILKPIYLYSDYTKIFITSVKPLSKIQITFSINTIGRIRISKILLNFLMYFITNIIGNAGMLFELK